MKNDITLCEGKWGNFFFGWDFRRFGLAFRISVWERQAYMFILEFLSFHVQLTLWSKTMRKALMKKDDAL